MSITAIIFTAGQSRCLRKRNRRPERITLVCHLSFPYGITGSTMREASDGEQ